LREQPGRSGDEVRLQFLDLAAALPLAVEDGEMQLLVPLALEQRVLAVVCLEAHAQPLQHLGRAAVAGTTTGEHAMKAELIKGDVERRPYRFGAIALPAELRTYDETDLRLAGGCIRPLQRNLADQLPVVPADHGEADDVAGPVEP